jgi:hypothetical protein
MKLSSNIKRTGICAACGKPTKLLIHQGCGEKIRKDVKPKKRKYCKEFVDRMSNIDE